MPKVAVVQGIARALLSDGSMLSPAQATQAGLVRRNVVAFNSGLDEAQLQDVDPWEESQDMANQGPATGGVPGSGAKDNVLKMSTLVDQSDDSELIPPKNDQVEMWFMNYTVVMGQAPGKASACRFRGKGSIW